MTNDERQKNKEWCRDWYRRNAERKYAMQVRRRQDIARFLDEAKRAAGCRDCGEGDPACLVFHHRDPKTKSFDVGRAYGGRLGMKAVREELAKCDVLCANCHLIHHWNEKQDKKRERPK